MYRMTTLCLALLSVFGPAVADEPSPAEKAPQAAAAKPASVDKTEPSQAGVDKTQLSQPRGDVKMSGMSILGNEEAPKSLVIVPWKSSQMGDMASVSRLLDSSLQPVDKEVFLRELAYYEIRAKEQ
jgi:hypothetical protein